MNPYIAKYIDNVTLSIYQKDYQKDYQMYAKYLPILTNTYIDLPRIGQEGWPGSGEAYEDGFCWVFVWRFLPDT